jgi:sucrose-6F-phosphate phosphohydrolase
MKKKLLVSDIDGTLLKGEKASIGLETLRMILSVYRNSVYLVYATGRSFCSTWSLVTAGVLPRPAGIVASVGTELWLPPWKTLETTFEKSIVPNWKRSAVMKISERFPGLEPQPLELQSPLKASFFSTDKSINREFDKALRIHGLQARMVYSDNRYLDVLPLKAGKRNAVEYVRRLWGVCPSCVLACGDSFNDLDMLEDSRFLGVAVGNSEAGLCEGCAMDSLHKSSLPFAAGVLEGAEVFNFWS